MKAPPHARTVPAGSAARRGYRGPQEAAGVLALRTCVGVVQALRQRFS